MQPRGCLLVRACNGGAPHACVSGIFTENVGSKGGEIAMTEHRAFESWGLQREDVSGRWRVRNVRMTARRGFLMRDLVLNA